MLNLFKRNEKPSTWGVDEESMVVHAFNSGGTEYFMFKEAEGAYCMRALSAMSAIEEMDMRCTREYLLLHTQAFENVFSDPNRIKMQDAFILNNNLKERLEFIIPTEDLLWRMCAVAFFDKNENPRKYDPEYGKKKIEKWKKDQSIPDFFLSMPIKIILGLPDISANDLEACLKLMKLIDQKHLNDLLSNLTSQQQKSDITSALLSQKSLQSI